MKDDRVERVLKALGEVEAPVGMERRVLARLEAATSAKRESGWLWPVRGLALAAMVCVAFVVPMHYRVRRVVVKRSDVASASTKPSPGAAAESVAEDEPKATVRPARVVHRAVMVPLVARREERAEESVIAAGNHPAPPMPLTEEERLLLQIAHRGDQKEYAMLDPGVRAARDADDKAEFKDFFTDPAFLVPLKIENNR